MHRNVIRGLRVAAAAVFMLVFIVAGQAFAEKAAAALPDRPDEMEEGVHLVIDKSANRLTVFLNNHPVRSFPVATGRSKALTPSGDFSISTKIKNPWYIRKNIPGGSPRNPLGTRWLGLSVPGTGGYTYGIHGTNNPYSIGSHASSGCIRMYNRDVEWLFRHIPKGTRVIVKE
ncbi:L,D-transpeptidase [Paenibacillus hamazuiensis]|uniref:L,D-transpeptidase n=1 Tax=Paenibacillus hamazuiensis TaxID=2936508 RepID=UPI00200BBCD2|nr:L,D-transpeptidase [Paenibacillus hamazuiensis]